MHNIKLIPVAIGTIKQPAALATPKLKLNILNSAIFMFVYRNLINLT